MASVVSDSVRPQRWQPTRLPCPWDSPGKNTGVGCHFLLQCMKVKSETEVAQSCPTPNNPMYCRPPGSSVHGICQARVLEWVAIAFSGKSTILNKNFKMKNHCFPNVTKICVCTHGVTPSVWLQREGEHYKPWNSIYLRSWLLRSYDEKRAWIRLIKLPHLSQLQKAWVGWRGEGLRGMWVRPLKLPPI